MVEGARLESVYTAKPYRGFESLPLRHFYPVERSPHADAALKRQGTARFGREPLNCDVGTLGFERSLSALFLSTSGLRPFWYGF